MAAQTPPKICGGRTEFSSALATSTHLLEPLLSLFLFYASMILMVCQKNRRPYLPRISDFQPFRFLKCLILVSFLKFKVLLKAETECTFLSFCLFLVLFYGHLPFFSFDRAFFWYSSMASCSSSTERRAWSRSSSALQTATFH